MKELDLANPSFNQSSQIDIILGNDSERFININGIKKNVCGLASAYNTIFGWVLSGPINGQIAQSFTTSVQSNESKSLDDFLKKFWEQEELPQITHISKDHQYCEEFYRKTTISDDSGRYIVWLPFKKEFPESLFLSTSGIIALSQYSRMKISLAKDPQLEKEYNSVLNESHGRYFF